MFFIINNEFILGNYYNIFYKFLDYNVKKIKVMDNY